MYRAASDSAEPTFAHSNGRPLAIFAAGWKLNARHIAMGAELLALVLSIAALMYSLMLNFDPAQNQRSGSDFKTVYAASTMLHNAADPYSFTNLARVFYDNRAIQPTNWYAHAPVYPPFTLTVVSPVTALPMGSAVYAWMGLSAFAMTIAAFVLSRCAATTFRLSLRWRLLLIAFMASSTLLRFGLEMVNVSVLAAALCIVAVVASRDAFQPSWWSASAIALALLLKPHLALWIVLALLISRSSRDRIVALRASLLATLGGVATLVWLATQHRLGADVGSYLGMVGSELGGGSMAATNRELIEVAAQITSLRSLLGYWFSGASLTTLNLALLVAAFATLCWLSLRARECTQAYRLTRIAAWCAFGLVATYHRAHDGIVLLIVLPYVVARLRHNGRDAFAWAFLILFTVMAIGPDAAALGKFVHATGLAWLANFILYRQAATAAALLLPLLLAETARQRQQALPAEIVTPEEAPTAALAAA